MKNKKGFTLIEVMVVVLIIAGLAAIAYPSYTKVIMKARIAEAFSLAEIVREAQQRYLVVNSEYFSNFIPAHTTGRTRLIKSGDLSISNHRLIKDNYAISIANAVQTPTTQAVQNGCIIVKYHKTITSGIETAPIFTIYTHVEDSKIWCTDTVDNDICSIIPASTLEQSAIDCE